MKKQIEISQSLIFATPVWETNISSIVDSNELVDYAYELYESGKSVKRSNRLGFHSDYIETNNEYIDDRFKLIMQEVVGLCKSIVEEQLFHSIEDKAFAVEAWANINSKYSYNQQHIHGGNCLLSAVYYAQVPKNSGEFYFKQDNKDADFVARFGIDKFNSLGTAIYRMPKEGDIYVFPSWIDHGVEQNLSDEDRISFAFNIKCERLNNNQAQSESNSDNTYSYAY